MAAPPAPLLEMRSVSKRFPGVQALAGVDLSVARGEVHALVGENGAGKSTLIKILAGLQGMDSGSILFDGRPARLHSPLDSLRAGLAVIHQDFELAPNLTVEENLLLGKEPSRAGFLRRRLMAGLAAEQLKAAGLRLDANALVGGLTVAQRQRVAIAKALSSRARLLVMDEPTSALAPDEIARLLELIGDLRRGGTSVLYISHRLGEVFAIADAVTVLRDGRRVATRSIAETTPGEIVSLMVGRPLRDRAARAAPDPGETLLTVRRLGRRGAFSDVSFDLHAGEILGVYGLKGAGRSELARVIFGLDRRDGGLVFIAGAEARFRSAREAVARGIGFVPEDRKAQGIFPNLNVKENASIVGLDDLSRRSFIDKGKEDRLVAGYLERLRIRASGPAQPILDLSGGNQQKVMLARWLAVRPRVLILDEPTAGIDVGAKAEIYALMDELAGRGLGLIVISSDLPEVLAVSDRILVMHEGRVVARLAAEEAGEELIMNSIHSGEEGNPCRASTSR